ncbi:Heptahelical transmembrane protein [Quillaja saponaria]|uniref:Heptahelical transmembrane protein n=1 Tax=Quillaja saponaria TaxID=32244 RepID=A0AAD7PJN2_QUISA|nr:Heptahelical transmembrane protein [Quillaja saponaria]
MSLSERRDISKRKGEEMDETHHQKSSIFSHLTVTGGNSSSSWQKKGHEGGKGRKRYPLISFWELPEYMKDNEYILNYYRANWPLKEALFSVFRWHNETLNVWTHLIGFLLFLGLTVMNLMQVPHVADLFGLFTGCLSSSSYTNVSRTFKDMFVGTIILIDLKQPSKMETSSTSAVLGTSRWPFFVFLGGSMFCLLSSSICHLFCCHSHSLNLFLVRIDYVGIVVMIITSFFPSNLLHFPM